MKKYSFFFLLFFLPVFLYAQQGINTFSQERIAMTQKGMLVLGSWATANLLLNPILQLNTDGSRKYFHQMNVYWNVVNLGIAGVGYYSATHEQLPSVLSEAILAQNKIEKTLLFNAALDITYVVGGVWLIEKSKHSHKQQERLKGYGQSLILQGTWLFSFDLVFYLVQNHHGKELLKQLDHLSLSPYGLSLSFQL